MEYKGLLRKGDELVEIYDAQDLEERVAQRARRVGGPLWGTPGAPADFDIFDSLEKEPGIRNIYTDIVREGGRGEFDHLY